MSPLSSESSLEELSEYTSEDSGIDSENSNCNDLNDNDFDNEVEFLKNFEENYEEECWKNVENDFNEEAAQSVAENIKQWLLEMNKSLNYLYTYEPSDEDEERLENIFDYEHRVCDPYIYVEDIDEDDVDEIINIVNNKRITKIQGKCSVKLKDGSEIIGRWQNGIRQGQGSYCSPALERLGVSMLAGSYSDGCLTGVARAHMMDGSIREGWFVYGFADGPFKGDIKGTGIVWLGSYRSGIPSGLCWESVLGGFWRVGWLDSDGEFTGKGIAMIYPDLKTAIVGKYKCGQLVTGAWSRVKTVTDHCGHSGKQDDGLLVPAFETMSNTIFKQWPSKKLEMTNPPHLRDPYEDQMVEVCSSSISGSGEGLRVKQDVEPGTIVAYYHGLRMKASDENPFGPPTGYAIYLEWDRDKRETSDVLDISPECQSTKNYTATLAHKVNHSFNPNCEWVHAMHPCYGKIPAIKTMDYLCEGEELFIHYGFDMDEAPQWYKDFWMNQM